MGALNGISITTNINLVGIEFDKLITHINSTLRQPFNLDLNINQIQQQLSQVTKQTEQFKATMSSSMSGTGNTGGLDKVITTVKELEGQMGKVASQVTTISSNMGQTISTTKNYVSLIGEALTAEKQVGEAVIKTTDNYKAQLAVNDKIVASKEKAISMGENSLVERENNMLIEANNLLKQEYDLTNQISIAQQKGLAGQVEELNLQREIISAKLDSSMTGLNNSSRVSQTSMIETENELLRQQMLVEAGIGDKQVLNTARIEEQIALYQGRMNPQIDALLVKMKALGIVDTTGIEKYRMELNSLTSSNFNKGQMTQSFNDLKTSANANIGTMQSLTKETKSFFSEMGDKAGKFAEFALVGGIIMGTISVFKQAIASVTELDNSMNALRIDMMGANENAFQAMADGAMNLNVQLGTNIKDITDIMEVYSNANSTAQEILSKTAPSAILSNISGMTGRDASDAVQSVLLVFDEFKNSSDSIASQGMKVSDIFASIASKLSLDFKTGLTSMSESVKTSGAVINEAGMNLTTYSAIVGKLAETSRLSGETIGASIDFVDLVA